MNKVIVVIIALLAVTVGLAVVYPGAAQRAFFVSFIKADSLLLKHWHKVASTDQSYESMALERLARFNGDSNVLDLGACRSQVDTLGSMISIPWDIVVERVNISRHDGSVLPAYWLTPPGGNKTATILYLHGGAFIAGGFYSHGGIAAELGRRADAKVLFVDYRLAPEHPFSAQIEDSVAAYKWLIYDQKIAANRTVFAGDSAGGGLVLLTLLALQDEDKGTIPAPAAALTMAAWTDLATDRPSFEKNAESDVFVKEAFLNWAAALATNTRPEDRAARRSHKVSPIFASADKLAKLPPLYMIAGEREVLLDDTTHFAGKAIQAGGDVKLVVVPHMQHVHPALFDYLPESDRDMTLAANWIKKQVKQVKKQRK